MGFWLESAFFGGVLVWIAFLSVLATRLAWLPTDLVPDPPFYSDVSRTKAIQFTLCGVLTPLILWAWTLVSHETLWPAVAVSVASAVFVFGTLRGYRRGVTGKTYGVLTALFLILVIVGLDVSLIVMFWHYANAGQTA